MVHRDTQIVLSYTSSTFHNQLHTSPPPSFPPTGKCCTLPPRTNPPFCDTPRFRNESRFARICCCRRSDRRFNPFFFRASTMADIGCIQSCTKATLLVPPPPRECFCRCECRPVPYTARFVLRWVRTAGAMALSVNPFQRVLYRWVVRDRLARADVERGRRGIVNTNQKQKIDIQTQNRGVQWVHK